MTKGFNNNPFPGLRAFKGTENHLFFGREEHIEDVLSKLDRNHFVAVVGTSGTGKSSLIRAGVLPAIEAGAKSKKGEKWIVVTITPGSSPIENLARSIVSNPRLVKDQDRTSLEKRLVDLMKHSTLGLVQIMRSVLEENDKLLILVDQFEEVFRFAEDEERDAKAEYDQFVNIIIDTVRQRDVPIYSILTLRSDFLGDCVAFEGLPEAINDGHYLVPRMNEAQLKRAITGPIDYANGKISPRLIQHITQDITSSSDQLPILQHAMMRCWEYWKKNEVAGEPMDMKHLEAIGDLNNALSTHADEAFQELSEPQKLLTEQIFKCLTTKKADNRGVRRPMSLAQLSKVTQASNDEVLDCLKPFQRAGRSFILPGLEVASDDHTIFDISHESLMRGWDRLKNWVDEEMESSELFLRICTAASLYKVGASALWRNPELQLAIDWVEKQKPTLAWGELYSDDFDLAMQFIEASKKADLKERQAKNRRTVIIRSSVASFVIVISILAGWALVQTNIANQKTKEAEEQSQLAIQQKLQAEQAKEQAQSASEQAKLSKEEAEDQAKLAEEQARIADEQKQIAEIEKGRAQSAAQLALTKQQLADQKSEEAIREKQRADSARTEAMRLRLVATSQNLSHESEQITNDPDLAALLAMTSYELALANGGDINEASLYMASSKAVEQVLPEYSEIVLNLPNKVMALNASSGKLNVIENTGDLVEYSLDNLEIVASKDLDVKANEINTVYASPDMNRIAFGLNSFQLSIIQNQASPKIFSGHEGLIRSVAFRSSNPVLISGGRDSQVLLWDEDGRERSINFDSRIKSISSLPNADDFFVGCENGVVYRVNISTRSTEVFSSKSPNRVESLEISKDGSLIAVGYSGGVTQVLSKSGELLKELIGEGSISFIKMDLKQELLVIGTSSRMIRMYNLLNLNKLPIEIELDRPIEAIDLDRDNNHLYVYCSDGTIRKYPTKTKWFIDKLKANTKRKLTQEEWKTFIGSDIPYLIIKPE